MVMSAWVMLALVGDMTDAAGDPILMRGDDMPAVSWVSRSGGVPRLKGLPTHDNAGAPSTSRRMEPHFKTYSRRAEPFNGGDFTEA